MPYQSSLTDTLIVGSQDLQTLNGVYLLDLGFLIAPGTLRGSPDVIPGRKGQLGAALKYDAYTFTVPLEVRPENGSGVIPSTAATQRGQFLANLRDLADVVKGTGGLVTLTRRITKEDGSTYDSTTANGQFLGGLTPTETDSPSRATFELQFLNLSGCWSASGVPDVI